MANRVSSAASDIRMGRRNIQYCRTSDNVKQEEAVEKASYSPCDVARGAIEIGHPRADRADTSAACVLPRLRGLESESEVGQTDPPLSGWSLGERCPHGRRI